MMISHNILKLMVKNATIEEASDTDGALLEYIRKEDWKVIQNGTSKKIISTGKDGLFRVLHPPVYCCKRFKLLKKKRKAKKHLADGHPTETMRRFSWTG
ncbi:hypothetical protein Tco_0255207 [Tanacetum coccineum]